MRNTNLYLTDIFEAIEYIQQYVQGMSFDEFSQDRKTIDAVVRNFEIIGEASKNIPDDIRNQYPDIPWREMAGMRDKLIHHYFGVDLDTVWKTTKNSLPQIRVILATILGRSI